MKNVIFDCDNTYGVPDCDVDDGLTLIYLLGNKDVNLLGVTTTYGNNKVKVVYPNTIKMVKELNARGIATEPVRIDDYTGKKMTFFQDPDGLPLEIHE